jgi:7-keto-8-aminopelargonate synthetase-like enzyme
MIESRLAAALKLPGAVTFSSGETAIRQTLSALLTPQDQVLVDSAAPYAVFETVCASGADLYRFPTGSLEAVERRLDRLAMQPGRVVIAVPALSPLGSKVWDLAELSALAQAKGALLVVDTSHDLGSMGQEGGGVMEIQGCTGRADIVLGSLDACFGAAGGFAAFRDPDLLSAVRRIALPLSPESARSILAATGIAFGAEGCHRRRLLHRMSLRLRNHLMADGAWVMGNASPLVPILLPAASALHRTALLESAGPRVTLLQAPSVPRHAPRWRVELSALHSLADIDDLAELIRDVTRAFDRAPIRLRVAV